MQNDFPDAMKIGKRLRRCFLSRDIREKFSERGPVPGDALESSCQLIGDSLDFRHELFGTLSLHA